MKQSLRLGTLMDSRQSRSLIEQSKEELSDETKVRASGPFLIINKVQSKVGNKSRE